MPASPDVRSIMTVEVVTLSPDQTIHEGADLLAKHRFGAAPVVDDAGVFAGLLRDEDLLVSESNLHMPTMYSLLGAELVLPSSMRRWERELRQVGGSTVGEVMQVDAPTVTPDTSLEALATLMHDSGATHVPVVDEGGKVVGIVARGDLVRHLAATD